MMGFNISHTKKIRSQLIFLALLTAFPISAYAQNFQYSDASIPSLMDYTRGNGFVQALGVKLGYGNSYRGSDQSVLEASLDGAVQWRRQSHLFFIENFNVNGIELGWRNVVRPTWLLQSGVRHETVLPSSRTEDAGINQFPHRGSQVFGFFEVRRSLDAQWSSWLTGRVSGGPSDFGVRAELAIGHQFLQNVYGAAAEIELFSTFGDEEQMNNYFGISQSDSIASGLSQINLQGGYRSSGINAIYRKTLLNNIYGVVTGRFEYYSSEVEKSDLVTDALEASLDVSVVYRFGHISGNGQASRQSR